MIRPIAFANFIDFRVQVFIVIVQGKWHLSEPF